jgi:hypothetical protein
MLIDVQEEKQKYGERESEIKWDFYILYWVLQDCYKIKLYAVTWAASSFSGAS